MKKVIISIAKHSGFIKFILRMYYGEQSDYCEICGLPINKANGLKTWWAETYELKMKEGNYLYSICKDCRRKSTWPEISKAYEKTWDNLAAYIGCIQFTEFDYEKAVVGEKTLHLDKLLVKFWIKKLKTLCKTEKDQVIYCSVSPKNREICVAVKYLSMRKYKIEIINNKIVINPWEKEKGSQSSVENALQRYPQLEQEEYSTTQSVFL